MHIFRDIPQKMISKWQIRYIYHKITWLCRPLWCRACHQDASNTGGVCPGIAKHHGRYSNSDHLCQDGEEWTSRRKRLRRRIFVKYAVEISDLPLFSSRDVCKNKGYRIIGGKQCHSVNKCILFEITRMQSVNRRIAALFYASIMKVLKVRPGVRRKKWFHRQISAARTTRYYNAFFIFKLKLAWKSYKNM